MITNATTFFARHGIRSEKVEPVKRSFMKLISSFIGLSVLAGGAVAVPAIVATANAITLVEPAATAWKELPEKLSDVQIGEKNVFYDVYGQPFAEIWEENRIPLSSLDEVSPWAIKALVATEDRTFYEHDGYDPKGIARAFVAGQGGGSGITQQLVKNLQFYDISGESDKMSATENSIERKIRELKLAVNYEKEHSKDEILLTYLNTVSFGSPNTYSIQSAANGFFHKNAKDLTIAESSAIIGTLKNPALYDMREPIVEGEDLPKWKQRQGDVLDRMVAEGAITETEANAAWEEKLTLYIPQETSGNCANSKNPLYCDYTLKTLRSSTKLAATQEERDAIIRRGGLHVKTHYDPKITNILQEQLNNEYGVNNRVVIPAAIIKKGGGVSAIAVNRNYGTGDGATTINLPLNPSGTGSTFKMITLGAALKNGFNEEDLAFSSRCPLYDANYDTPPGGFTNATSCAYQGGYMDYMRATQRSSNTWFVELEIKVGVDKVKEFARSVGLTPPSEIGHRSLSYTLGVTEHSPVDMAAAFATYTNGGVYCPATPIISYAYRNGSAPPVSDSYNPEGDSCRRVLSPKDASVVLRAMNGVVKGEFAVPGVVTAGKTGTNQFYNSTWVHLSGEYSAYYNMYDPNTLTNGIEYVDYRGYSAHWLEHTPALTSSNVFSRMNHEGFPIGDVQLYSNDDSMTPVPLDKRDFLTVPIFIGLTPEDAKGLAQSRGLHLEVLKETVSTPELLQPGRIVTQSTPPGTGLAKGTKRVIEVELGH